jgi:LuxR family maltose regulon positive regulatory protein
LIAALQIIDIDIGKGVLSALQSPQPPPTDAILTPLINEVAALPDPLVLVLDDVHLIAAQPIHDALAFLLRHLPRHLPPHLPPDPGRGMHLVIATREDPPLPLARLRARGQLTELRAADLKFTPSEAAEFLNQAMGLDLSAEDIAALEARTEGWIAGLQLAAISMQGSQDSRGFIRSFAGSHRFVLDYLAEEVLHQQPESVQTFLLHTAVLDRLCGPLCDAVRFGISETPARSVGTASQAILEMLDRANLFIVPLDGERRWYRYHHLFADLLRQRQHQVQPEQVPALYQRASAWYQQHGFIDEAIAHALRAEDSERAADLIEEHVDTIWQRGEHTRLRRWLARLPAELVCAKPHLCIIHAWNLFTSGQYDAAERTLRAAERALDARTERTPEPALAEQEPSPGAGGTIRGRIAALRAFLASYRGDLPVTIQHARQALDRLPEQDVNWRSTAAIALGDAYALRGELADAYRARLEAVQASQTGGNIYMIARLKLADVYRQQGQVQRTIAICQQQWQLAQESGMSQTVVAGWLLAIWGEALAERNDLDQAIQQASKGVKLTERGQDAMVTGWSYLCLIRVLFSRGDLAAAEAIAHKMEALARERDVPPWIANPLAAWQARIWLAQDDLDAASQWAGERGLDAGGGPILLHEMEYLALARILIARGRLDETSSLLQRLLEAAEAGGHTSRAIEVLALQALALQAQEDTDRAIATLERALTLAEPGGLIRTFVDEGPPMARLLYGAVARGIAPEYARRLLVAFSGAEPEQPEALEKEPPTSEFVEPLSERELEVLQLIAEGLTNREIASRLFLALNTVKAHARNIYGKLDVHSRTQAIARCQALGLLPRARD